MMNRSGGITDDLDPNDPDDMARVRDAVRGFRSLWQSVKKHATGRAGREKTFVTMAWRTADRVQAEALSRLPEEMQPACRKGCAYCCHIAVDCVPSEARKIAALVARQWGRDPERMAGLRARLERQVELKRRFPGKGDLWDYSQARVPCAFLKEEGTCSIYEVRPMACRNHHSLDASACEQALSSTYTTFPQSLELNKVGGALVGGFGYVCVTEIEGLSEMPDWGWEQTFFPALVLAALPKPKEGRQ